MKRSMLFFFLMHVGIHAMEKEVDLKKKKEIDLIKQKETALLWNIILTHGLQWFDHSMICSLAVSRQYDAILHTTALLRKNFLLQNRSLNDKGAGAQWHKYGTACGKVSSFTKAEYAFILEGDWLIVENQHISENCLKMQWDGFQEFVPYKPKGFFDREGNFCVYGCGEIINTKRRNYSTIIEYCVFANGKKKATRCMTDIIYKGSFMNLKIFLEFPLILAAFFNSSKVYLIESEVPNDDLKIFSTSGIILPKNYKKHEPYFSNKKVYKSFDDLPQPIRIKLASLYKEQRKKKKNNKGLLGWLKK